MQIKPLIEIEDLDGKPIPLTETRAVCPNCGEDMIYNKNVRVIVVETGENLTLKVVCVNSLLAAYENEKEITGMEKLKRGRLAEKIYNAKEDINLESEEITLLKKLIGKNYSTLTVMRAYELLESEKKSK